jgi:PPOX class probable F420-dependent enzyme
MKGLNSKHRKLFEEPNFAHLATVGPDGAPQSTPVWVDLEGECILVNTAENRVKARNVKHNPKVAVSITNHENPYEMVTITGRVVDVTSEGAEQHIDKLAKKYLGKDRYPYRQEGEKRVILKIRPDRVAA